MIEPTPPEAAEIINKWAEQVARASAEADPSPRYTDEQVARASAEADPSPRYTDEQVARASAEADPSPRYTDGRPKYHRHFGDYEIHIDESCTSPSTRTRVYVFDAEYLDEHEAHIRADERAKAYDDVRTIQNAKRGVR